MANTEFFFETSHPDDIYSRAGLPGLISHLESSVASPKLPLLRRPIEWIARDRLGISGVNFLRAFGGELRSDLLLEPGSIEGINQDILTIPLTECLEHIEQMSHAFRADQEDPYTLVNFATLLVAESKTIEPDLAWINMRAAIKVIDLAGPVAQMALNGEALEDLLKFRDAHGRSMIAPAHTALMAKGALADKLFPQEMIEAENRAYQEAMEENLRFLKSRVKL